MRPLHTLIAPSVLASDFSRLGDEAERVLHAGADWVHLDVMDGHFVPNISFGAPIVKSLRKRIPRPAFFDVHLMVSDPEKWIPDFAAAGADQFVFHVETTSSTQQLQRLVSSVAESGMKVGIAIKPNTPLSSELLHVLEEGKVFTVLVMTVEPGFGGQKFKPEVMPKVKELRKRFPALNIQVDGGVNGETAEIARRSGANVIVAGTSVFTHSDTKQAIMALRGQQ